VTPGQDNNPAPKSGIYLIRCVPTGKVYVGSALRIKQRWVDHCKALIDGKHHSPLLQRAWRKYGEEAFEFIVIVYCHRGDLLWLEQGFMNQYKSYDPAHGFNINRTAGSRLGMAHRSETKAKLRAANLGKTYSAEVKAKKSASMRGKQRSAEHCANLSTALRGIRRSPEHCKRMSEMKTELCSSKEFRVKMSKASARFTDEQLTRIRQLTAEGVKYRLIAGEFGCSIALICDIKHGRRYQLR
jgi:group I intron endonuclease